MIIAGLKIAGKIAKGVYKIARKTPKKVYKYGASAAGGAYLGSAIGKKSERKRVLKTVKTVLDSSGSGKKWFK
tara:strand:- start:143 stop:361 length:219 start_codon:yes stop_codon:yes gene_type:complete